MKNDRGNQMELDGFAESLSLAFEHQGRQHSRYVSRFHSHERQLKQRQVDDEAKRRLCKEHGVSLIEIPEVPTLVPYDQIKTYIAEVLQGQNTTDAVRRRLELFNTVDVNYQKAYAVRPLKEIEKIAGAKGGVVVSHYYLGMFHRLQFRCGKGHSFSTQPVNVVHNDQWCPTCAKERQRELALLQRKPMSALRAMAIARGGQVLSTGSLGAHTRHEWMCASGHIFAMSPANVHMGKWCPRCARLNVAKEVAKKHEDIFNRVLKERGGVLLSEQYVTAKTKLRIRCRAEHEWTARPDAILRGAWCPQCKGGVSLTLETVRTLATRRGGVCLSESYDNAHRPLVWRCQLGHTFSKPYTKVQQGAWCRICAKSRKTGRTSA